MCACAADVVQLWLEQTLSCAHIHMILIYYLLPYCHVDTWHQAIRHTCKNVSVIWCTLWMNELWIHHYEWWMCTPCWSLYCYYNTVFKNYCSSYVHTHVLLYKMHDIQSFSALMLLVANDSLEHQTFPFLFPSDFIICLTLVHYNQGIAMMLGLGLGLGLKAKFSGLGLGLGSIWPWNVRPWPCMPRPC